MKTNAATKMYTRATTMYTIMSMTTSVMVKPTTSSKVTDSKVANYVNPSVSEWKIMGVYGKMNMLRKISVEI